ncbi:DUF1289 domain-containing protein [Novosphingobium cyanobacteriorum]|uniref:DUF1289 domain-containing protein n=1 Tax=Novosphingobium cyanobacteriorum TaxID=3024215 RepID=A0ABT6CP33_9SPHN|nr:DUF1289 domain-containing protein [Novosphingobium cyanobacteriorum]MDF8335677.1 DUF1289 domain-containing protein [Novosphingobium cyanobacteriorum]
MTLSESTPSGAIKSPCVRICRIDPADGRCMGCSRTTDEIREWFAKSDQEKLSIIAMIPDRMRERLARLRAAREAAAAGKDPA